MLGAAGRFRFEGFVLDLGRRELRGAGGRVPLQDKPFELLCQLVASAPRVVGREALRQALWGQDTFVDVEHGLNTAVRKLREALGDDAHAPRFIETVARHGYRFAAPVESLPAEPPPAVAAPGGEHAPAPVAGTRRRWLLPAALAAVLVAALGSRLANDGDRTSPDPQPIRSLAVLPLLNLSGDPQEDYFADGMTEALITELARAGSWRVTSRTSVMAYRGKQRRVPEIARELGVDALLEGSVSRAADRVRVTAQLIDARSDRHLWAQTFESRAADVLLLQSQIAAAVTRDMSHELRLPRRESAARSLDPAAYDAYLRGRFFWNKRTAEGFRKALGEFERATQLDPAWALGWAGLADTYGLLGISTYNVMPPAQAMPKARAAARRALELDASLAEPHASLAWVSFTYDWEFPAAERDFRRAIELDPNYATAHQWYSNYLCAMGRLDEARAEIAQAMALDPLSLVINNESAWPDYYARRYDESDARYRRTLELDPHYPVAHFELGTNLAARGRFAEAIAQYEMFRRVESDSPEVLGFLAHAEAGRGNRARALELRRDLAARTRAGYVAAYAVAVAELGLGEKAAAIDWLEKAQAAREDAVLYLGVDPLFDGLRGEPRFAALLERIGVPNGVRGGA